MNPNDRPSGDVYHCDRCDFTFEGEPAKTTDCGDNLCPDCLMEIYDAA